ncbi:PREDICTED: protein kri1-like, partial [Camelina sativa]|uniref:Protein kri1-like n=1 Tax=Camelina sativa TaxID=90675 RepID=A0ABM1RBR0_CAMSA
MMRPPIPKAIPDDDDGDSSQIKGFEVDDEYGKRLLHNKNRVDLQRLEEMKKRGVIVDEEDDEPESEPDDDLDNPESDLRFVDVLLKVKNKDPSIMDKNAKFYESDESSEGDEKEKKKRKKKEKKKKKMYLKDVQAQHLLEEGPEFVEEDEEKKVTTYAERQRELRKAVTDALETGEDESDDDLFRVVEKEGDDDDVEVNEELAKKMDEYFGKEAEVFENQFLKDYLVKQLWKEKEEIVVDEAELDELDDDEEAVWDQEDYENLYRHEENAGEIIISQSRVVDGSVRKKDSARKAQRKNKEERMKMAEIERKEELKRLKNVKKKEMKEKMKKVLSVAGFKDGEECPLDAKDFDDEFDPEEYDKMMKAAFDDNYYGAEDSDLNSDEDDDGEKPDFDKEDDLLGLPKDWDVIQGGDGFVAAREKVLKQKEKVIDDDEEEESDESSEGDEKEKKKKKKKEKKKKKMYLKDVQAQHLLEEGPEFVEEDEEKKVTTYAERQRELRKAVTDALETGEDESDDDLFRVVEKEGDDDDVEVNEELAKKMDEYFGKEAEVFENQFLKDYLVKQLWKEKEEIVVDEAALDELDDDEEAVWDQEDYEISYRHEENAGEIVLSQSRVVDGSVRKKDSARKAQRKNKEERMKMAEIERKEELKRLKNVKKKEMKEKMKKVLSVAGFKDGEECPLDAKDFDDEFDPEEYDKMMKAAFDDNYYGAEDSDLNSDEDDDGEKPDFDKEDDLLGLPKDWDVIQGGDGFVAAREKVLKQKEKVIDDDEEEEVEVEEEEVEEEKGADGKRKRKRKTSLVQRAKEALMEEYYKLDYEDTIGDLKTRFKYAKVQPNSYELGTEEILTLDDTDL